MNAGKVREGDCVFKILEVSDSNVEGISDVPSNAFSLMTEPPRVKRTAELAAAAEDDASATLSRTLEVYGLLSVELQRGRVRGLKTKVPEEELTHVQKMRRESNESRSGHREQASKHQCTKCPLGRRSPEPCRHRRFLAARGRARRGRRVCEPVVNEPDTQFLNLDQMQKRSSRETQSATDKGAGPRPKGTDGTDHKFRQRVNSHYKLMAVGRSRLGLVTKLHAAHCVVATLTLLAAYVGAAGPSVPHAVAAGVTALGAGACAYRAAAAAKSSVAPPTEQYASLVVAVGGLVLLALVAAVGEVVMATKSVSHAQLAIPAQLLGFIASAVGHDGASKLIAALAEAKGSRAQ